MIFAPEKQLRLEDLASVIGVLLLCCSPRFPASQMPDVVLPFFIVRMLLLLVI